MHYSSLFQYFFQFVVVPTLVNFLVYLFVNFLGTPLLLLWMNIQYNGTTLLLHALCAPVISEKKTILCSTCYTAVQINNCLKRISAIKITTMKITNDFSYEWKPSHAYAYHKIGTFHGEERWMGHKGGDWWMHCMYSGSTSQAQATLNSEKNQTRIVKLCKSEGIGQVGSQLVLD